MKLRVVTIVFNPGDELKSFCESLFRSFTDPRLGDLDGELVIVNNGDASAVLAEVASNFPCKVIEPHENLGYGRAANLGAKDFGGEWIMVANPDVVFTESSIANLLEITEEHPRAGVFGPKILTPEGDLYPSARHFPRLISGTGHALLGPFWKNNPFSRKYQANEDTTTPHNVDWLSGACLLIRSSAFYDVSGFDDRFFMFFEDTMLGEAMLQNGWTSVFVPDSIVIHDQGKSWRDRPAPMIRAHHDSAREYLSWVYSKPYQQPLRILLCLGLKVREAIMTRGKKH
ncbi:glycosyltransferase family 2 protein [Arcanobacterium ihumii]|uniref:glycosyltransferase family 2 protein n=1 Tax=Arcanobacterium ihumii TaxID=2138162 RepID=UPI000F53D99A|nr:glycosyltransferase family 2 protein [Arcanobacterium ihumii]